MMAFNGVIRCLVLALAIHFGEGSYHRQDQSQLELNNWVYGRTEYTDRDRPWLGRPQESPWLVLFYYPDDRANFCHGTLITASHVLTTAVCASAVVKNETLIVLGEYDVHKEQDCTGTKCLDPVQQRLAEAVIVHQEYNQETFENDLGVVVLNRGVTFTDSIKPICLPPIKLEVNQSNIYNILWTFHQPTPLQYRMKYIELDDCRQMVSDKINLKVGQICAKSYTNETIELIGGAGSALEVDYHNRVYQVAMLSIGILDDELGAPYVYVDIPKYVRWIHDIVEKNLSS